MKGQGVNKSVAYADTEPLFPWKPKRWDATPKVIAIVGAIQLGLAAYGWQGPNMSKVVGSECVQTAAAAVVVNWMHVWAAAAVVVAAAAASGILANRREFAGRLRAGQQDSVSTAALASDSKQTSSPLHRCHSLQRLMCLTVHAWTCMDMHGHAWIAPP